jgi:hypothetical protein
MQEKTPLGNNRTGAQRSPIDAERMQQAADALEPQSDTTTGIADVRLSYSADGEDADRGLGSVPPPLTLSGAVQTGVDMITGNRPQVLIDKLGERIAFERGGVRLYDGLLVKAAAAPGGLLTEADIELMREFRQQESQHHALVVGAVRDLGGDPTAQTPCADLVGVESLGLVQAMNDPRTSLQQCVHVMMDAELLDNAGWELLIELAREAGHTAIAGRFEVALQQEQRHLTQLRSWVQAMTRHDASLLSTEAAPA